MGLIPDRYAQDLMSQGVEYAAAEDAAFMAKDLQAEAIAKGALEATVKALAAYTGTDHATASEAIMLAADETQED